MTHPPGNPPSDPGGGDGTTGPGRTSLKTEPTPEPGMPVPTPGGPPKPQTA